MQPESNQAPQVPGQPYSPYPPPQMQQPMPNYGASRPGPSKLKLIVIVLFALLFLSVAGFGLWAFMERNDYKNNFDKKLAAALAKGIEENNARKEAEYQEREKYPLVEYKGPSAFGSLSVKYPKTWSAFVTENDRSTTPVDGYFHPNFVPGLQSGTAFALHIEVIEADYDKELKKFDASSKAGRVKVTPIQLSGIAGARVDGEFAKDKKGSVVLFQLRDKTVKITTESETFLGDFNDIILKNLTFVP